MKFIPRSVLITPALDPERLAKARKLDVDALVLDLEDSVPPQQRPYARLQVKEQLTSPPGGPVLGVRVNSIRTRDFCRDLEVFFDAGRCPGFILMSKVDSPAEVDIVRELLRSAGLATEIYIIIETPAAMMDLDALGAGCDGMFFGAADLSMTLGIKIAWQPLLGAREKVILACARYGIPSVDAPYFILEDLEGLRHECQQSRGMGFTAKLAVHPKQVPAINLAYRPSASEIEYAQRVIDASDGVNGGIAIVDGGMIGPPFVGWARRFVASRGEASTPPRGASVQDGV